MATGEIVDLKKNNRPGEIVPSAPMDFGTIVQAAIEKSMAPEALSKLLDVYERVKAGQAKEAFARAMSDFKAACPAVERRTENSQFKVTRNGQSVSRKYAALEDIERTIRGPLGAHGLHYRWGDAVVADGRLTMTCIVAHVAGHSESSSVVLPVESKAGCSEQQKFGAAMTYAQRYSLIQALGLTSCDEDTDGNEPTGNGDPITEHQAANLDALIDEVGADRKRFLAYLGVGSLSELPVAKFKSAISALESKRRRS